MLGALDTYYPYAKLSIMSTGKTGPASTLLGPLLVWKMLFGVMTKTTGLN